MTFSLALALPGLCLAAADTRFSFDAGKQGVGHHDGPDDLPVDVVDFGFRTTLPFHRRKLQKVGQSWATGVGAVLALRPALGVLAEEELDDPDVARKAVLSQVEKIVKKGCAAGLPEAHVRQTILFCAPFARVPGNPPWAFALAEPPSSARMKSESPLLTAFPPEMLPQQVDEVDQVLIAGLQSTGGLPDIVRAFAAAFHMCSLRSESCGPVVQIGLTVDRGPKGELSYYLSMDALRLSRLTDAEFDASLGEPV